MTYIFGARCSDGVVLVGDRKITDSNGELVTYREKIFHKFDFYVWASAGILGLANSFDMRFTSRLRQFEQFNQEEFFISAEESFEELTRVSEEYRYEIRKGNLQVLMATRIGSHASLHLLASIGAPTPVDGRISIGSGSPFSALWWKRYWKPTLTMRQAGSFAYWIVNHITEEGLDNAVGLDWRDVSGSVSQGRDVPQVWLIPDNPTNLPSGYDNRIRELTSEEIDLWEKETGERRDLVGSIFGHPLFGGGANPS